MKITRTSFLLLILLQFLIIHEVTSLATPIKLAAATQLNALAHAKAIVAQKASKMSLPTSSVSSLSIQSDGDPSKVAAAKRDVISLYRYVYTQLYSTTNIPVAFGFFVIIINVNTLEVITLDDFQDVAAGVSTSPAISNLTAIADALTAWCPAGNCGYSNVSVSLFMWAPTPVISYNVTFIPLVPHFHGSPMTYFINGNTGAVLYIIDGRHRLASSGMSLYDGEVSFNSNPTGGTYYLEDLTRMYGVFDCSFGNCSSTINRISDSDNYFDHATNAVNVAWATSKVLDYFTNTFTRNGMDGSYGPGLVTSADGSTSLFSHMINYGANYNDSTYTPIGIVYGVGDGSTTNQLVSLDFVGHEMMHGMIANILTPYGFVYSGESGAIEEAYCDIFGNMAERYVFGETYKTWQVGEDFYTPLITGDALRYIDYPHNGSNPDYITQLYTGISDNGGVHINCGIPSKAFYLLAKGGQHPQGGPVLSGIGSDAAAAIWWRALTTYMTPSAQFYDAMVAQGFSARDLYGSTSLQYLEVVTSWAVCGVGILPPPLVTQLVSNPSFEGSSLGWVLTGATAAFYVRSGTNPHTGHGYVMMGQNNAVSGSLSQSPLVIPSNAVSANITFYIEVVTAEVTGAGSLDTLTLNINQVGGSLLGTLHTYTNQDKYGCCAGYTKQIYNIVAYAGKTVQIEFDVVTSSSNPTTFYIDDLTFNVAAY